MDESVAVGKIHPTANRNQVELLRSALGCVGRCDEMAINMAKSGGGMIAIMQPKTLIDCVAAYVVWVQNVELDKEATVLEGGRVERNGVLECNPDEPPLTSRRANRMGDEKELVAT